LKQIYKFKGIAMVHKQNGSTVILYGRICGIAESQGCNHMNCSLTRQRTRSHCNKTKNWEICMTSFSYPCLMKLFSNTSSSFSNNQEKDIWSYILGTNLFSVQKKYMPTHPVIKCNGDQSVNQNIVFF
jgi:hypothetical protein